jgi:hypothetical protein
MVEEKRGTVDIQMMTQREKCCYITVDSAATALHNVACTYWCIAKQMHYKTSFSHKSYMNCLDFYENYTLHHSVLSEKKTF